eukprot:3827584-Pyramimonas_sp.AAC.1
MPQAAASDVSASRWRPAGPRIQRHCGRRRVSRFVAGPAQRDDHHRGRELEVRGRCCGDGAMGEMASIEIEALEKNLFCLARAPASCDETRAAHARVA